LQTQMITARHQIRRFRRTESEIVMPVLVIWTRSEGENWPIGCFHGFGHPSVTFYNSRRAVITARSIPK
jgi:hypothetical protein